MLKRKIVKSSGQKFVSKKSIATKVSLLKEICFGSLVVLSRCIFSNSKITYPSRNQIKQQTAGR